MNLLSLLIFLPLAAAVLLWLLPPARAKQVAALAMLAVLGLSTLAMLSFDAGGERYQLGERSLWVASLAVHYDVAVDGLSVLFLPATALLFIGTLIAHWRWVEQAPRLHYALLLLLESATLGIFCAMDAVLFFVFWEATLVPLYFLLGGWEAARGGNRAAARYFLFMLAGGVALLIAFVLFASSLPELSFDLRVWQAAAPTYGLQMSFFLLCLLGFGVKVPLVPLHTWLPAFALHAPGSLTALLLGLKLGAYGLLRIALPLAPNAALSLHWLLAGLGTVTLLYGAVSMLAQSNLRVATAFASLCHVGLVVLGLASLNAQAAQGAVALLLSFSVATGGAMLILEFLRQRTGSTDVRSLGGVAGGMPLLTAGYLICGLAGVGMPGTSSFPGEFLLVLATLQTHAGAGMAALFGLSIAAGAFLSLFRRAFFGPPGNNPEVARACDLAPRERIVLLVLVVLIGSIGLFPGPWLELVRPAAEQWAAVFVR